MLVDLYYRNPETGKVEIAAVYELTATFVIEKWPDQYSLKPFKKTAPEDVTDLRPPMPKPEDFKDEGAANGPPVLDRPER